MCVYDFRRGNKFQGKITYERIFANLLKKDRRHRHLIRYTSNARSILLYIVALPARLAHNIAVLVVQIWTYRDPTCVQVQLLLHGRVKPLNIRSTDPVPSKTLSMCEHTAFCRLFVFLVVWTVKITEVCTSGGCI